MKQFKTTIIFLFYLLFIAGSCQHEQIVRQQWTPSPGHSIVYDTTSYTQLETYVQDVIGSFRNDERVLFWDVYNEPKLADKFPEDDPLLARVLKWALEANPVQPITTSFWGWTTDNSENARNKLIAGYNDISGFHFR